MVIVAGDARIKVEGVAGENRYLNNVSRPALKVRFSNNLSDAELKALLENDWTLINDDTGTDVVLSTQSGYTILESHEVVFLKIGEIEQENTRLKSEVDAVAAFIPALLKGKSDDSLVALIQYIPEWTQGKYGIGDVRKNKAGYPMTCVQAHDSLVNPTHDIGVASLWAPYHAKSTAFALPWIAPTGAHDMYKANECMVYTDGKTYQCLSDTAYSPIEYAQAWKVVG